jgi:MFS family permease
MHMADLLDSGAGDASPKSGFLRDTRRSFAAVFANRNMRRIQLAFLGSTIGDWAYATAVSVWAYGVAGATGVGIWMAIRLALMAIAAPFTSALADKMPRKRLMLICDLTRAVLVVAAAGCLFLDTPPAPIFVLATAAALLGTPFLVAQRSLLPSVAERPEELTAANGTASTIDSLSAFVGPALAALFLGFTTVQVVFLLNALTFVWSMVMVLGVTIPARPGEVRPEDEQPEPEVDSSGDEPGPGFLTETSAGFRAIAADRNLVLATAAVCAQTVVAGASAVFMLVMADTILGTGARGMGFLNSVLGIGSVLGGMLAISRASRGRLGADLASGVLLWSLPLILITIWPSPVTCFVAMGLLGLGNPLVDVNLDTVVQRLAPDAVLGRVFGALEACLIVTMALGALAMPFLIDWWGIRVGLLVIAAPVVLVALAVLPAMRRMDAHLSQPSNVPLLARVDIFAPLAPAALESLARGAMQARFDRGQVLVREGDHADRFFVIETGEVEVTQSGRVLRREGPGEYFGEIGLLRDVPRTATITALQDTVVQVIDREGFLEAISGHREASRAAESIATRRLAV